MILYPRTQIDETIGFLLKSIPLNKRSTKMLKQVIDLVNKEFAISINISTIQSKLAKVLDFYREDYSQKEKLSEQELQEKMQSAVEISMNNIVSESYAEDLQSSLTGQMCQWMPSDADNQDLTHALNYFELFPCHKGLNGDFPAQRYGCQCGVKIVGDLKDFILIQGVWTLKDAH